MLGRTMKLFLRVYAECPSIEAASSIDTKIRNSLSAWSPQLAANIIQYWKIPEQFGFTYNLSPATEPSFEAIVSTVEVGWSLSREHSSERWAIWNRCSNNVFLTAEVAWANLELHE